MWNPEARSHPAWLLAAALLLTLTGASLSSAEPAFPEATFAEIGTLALPDFPFGFALPETALEGSLYLFGGASRDGQFTPAVRRYSPEDGNWEVFANALPYPWYNNERHNVALASNGKIYLGPGNGPGGFGQHDRILEFDPATGSAVERAPLVAPGVRLWGVALAPAPASVGGVYLLGGWNGGGLAEVRHYDPIADATTVIGHLSVGRTVGARVTHPNGRIYVFGGNTLGTLTAVDVLETATSSVRPVANPLGLRFLHGTQAWVGEDQNIYLWNPIADFLGASSDRIIRFEPATETFEILGDSPLPTGLPLSAVADPDRQRVLFFALALPGYTWGGPTVVESGVYSLTFEGVDTEPPTVESVTPNPAVLWPPNHRMVRVTIAVDAFDNVSAAVSCAITAVASNEAATPCGDGSHEPDGEILGPTTLLLRAERCGGGSGRIYTVEMACSDEAGNSTTASTTVMVPKSQGR